MDEPPLVSVVIATYNRSNVLPYSIRSALNQTHENIEVLVVGDGCSDDSQAVVERIEDPRVRWIGLEKNSGHQSEPNNVGLRQARGELIAYLGHDDLWLPHHLGASVGLLRRDFDVAYGLTLMVAREAERKILGPVNFPYQPGAWIAPSSVVHRKRVTDTIGDWQHYTRVDRTPESDLWRRAHQAGFRLGFVPRLSTIKIPAAWCKDVYRRRSTSDQEYWSARMRDEPHLEVEELASCYAGSRSPDINPFETVRFTRILRLFARETAVRIAQRLRPRRERLRAVERNRKRKGLTPIP